MKSPGWFEEKRQEILRLRSLAAAPITADCVFEDESDEVPSKVEVSGPGQERLRNLVLEVLRGADQAIHGTDYRSWLPLLIDYGMGHRSTHLVTDAPDKGKGSRYWRLDSSSLMSEAAGTQHSLKTRRSPKRHLNDARLKHKEPLRQSISVAVDDLAGLAAEYLEHLITSAFEASRAEKPGQPSTNGPLKNRPRWLKELLDKLGVTANELHVKHGGPDRKTIVRILHGWKSNNPTLDALARALTEAIQDAQRRGANGLPPKIELTDIPQS